MDLMELRRGLLMGMAGGIMRYASGSFEGDDTSSVQIQIGFEPDFLVIESDVDYSEAGWTGVGHVVIVKGIISSIIRHNNTTVSNAVVNTYPIVETGTDYGDATSVPAYCIYGTYANGSITLTNQNKGVGVLFVDGRQYTWKAYKVYRKRGKQPWHREKFTRYSQLRS